ncbi:alcohol dehydrogenase catalytic domain-containing protein [Actinomadura keratinilytica]
MSASTTAPATAPATRPRRRVTGVAITAWVLALVFCFPALWMVLTSFHAESDAATNPPSFAASLTLDGYRTFFGGGGGPTPWPPLVNSLTASFFSTVLVLLLALPAAYALSIRRVRKWTDVLFFFLSTKMLPVVAGLLPIYLFARNTGLLDNVWLLVLLYTSMNLPIAVWMMQSFLSDVPVSIIEAAQVDGARLPTVLGRVVAPVAAPGIAATALICFIFSWNELLFARVLTGVVASTAPVHLTTFVTSQGLFLAQLCAASVVVSLPVLAAATPPRTNSSRASPWEQSNEGSHRRSRRQGVLTTVPDPEPGPRDVVVKVASCGLCGTDLHILQGEFAPTLPIVPGHEFAGEIVAALPRHRTRRRRQGRRRPSLHCHECRYCRSGRGNLCDNWAAIGVTTAAAPPSTPSPPSPTASASPTTSTSATPPSSSRSPARSAATTCSAATSAPRSSSTARAPWA